MNCPNCNSAVPEGALFCGVCGYKFQQQAKEGIQQPWADNGPSVPSQGPSCPNCGTLLENGAAFCPECGMPVAQMNAAAQAPNMNPQGSWGQPQAPQGQGYYQGMPLGGFPQRPETQGKAAKPKKEKKAKKEKAEGTGGKKKTGLIILIAVLAVVVIAALIFVLTRGSSSSSAKTSKYALYLKDGEVMYNTFGKNGGTQVSTRFLQDGDMLNEVEPSEFGAVAAYLYITKDGKNIIYPDKITEGSDGPTMYYRSLTKPDQDPVKIDSNINSYIVSENEKTLAYLNASGTLYLYDLKKAEKTKLVSNVESFSAVGNLEEVLYLTDDYTLYLLEVGGDKVKISADVTEYLLTADGNSILYRKNDGSCYLKAAGEDKVKIASEATIVRIYDTGEVYYYETEMVELSADQFVRDDASGDSSYDSLRTSLKESTIVETQKTYYYFDGKDSTELFTTYSYGYDYDYAGARADNVAMTLLVKPQADVKLKLTEVSLSWMTYDLQDASEEAAEYVIAIKGTVYKLGAFDSLRVDNQLNVYYQEEFVEGENSADIYKMTYTNGKYSSPVKVVKDAYLYYWVAKDGDVFCLKDYNFNTETGDYYINDTLVDYDVLYSSVWFLTRFDLGSAKEVYYISEVNSKTEAATISYWDGSKTMVVAEDVEDLAVLEGNGILLLTDYSDRSHSGDLIWFHGGKIEQVDDDVNGILPLQNYEGQGRGAAFMSWSSYGYYY